MVNLLEDGEDAAILTADPGGFSSIWTGRRVS